MTVKFCRNCIYSKPDISSSWSLQCHNDEVNSSDEYALSGTKNNGCSALTERRKEWYVFPICGKKGKKFSPIGN